MQDVARFLKALSDGSRLRILWLLFQYQELCVCDLWVALGIAQSKASRHLATLRHAGLVVDRKVGAWSYYSLRPARNDLERAVLAALRVELARHSEAGRLVRNLQAWLRRKARDTLPDFARSCPTPVRKSASRRSGVRPIRLRARPASCASASCSGGVP